MIDQPALAVFTRDLRVGDNPMLVAAAQHRSVVPLFVLDDAALAAHGSDNRYRFLLESLRDLDSSLTRLGSGLLLRSGDWGTEVLRVASDAGATTIHVGDDVSAFAKRRLARLTEIALTAGLRVIRHPGVTVVAPGAVAPASGGEFKVFTPYYRRWLGHPWRRVEPAPSSLPEVPSNLSCVTFDDLPLANGASVNATMAGGEMAGLARLKQWAGTLLAEYADLHDDLAADGTSRMSPYLHFGCVSALEVATKLRERPGGEAFVRQLCWRDFYHQVLSAHPESSTKDYRDRGKVWDVDDDAFEAWATGRTGYPLVDAGMRQLLHEGFMHNRARMVVASFLVKDLYLDWRLGAAHFMHHLVDGDVANNQLNWQWIAGTGTDTNPNRIFNPLVQGERYDPNATYIRRYVPELAGVTTAEALRPTASVCNRVGYPLPIVDHAEAIAAYRLR